MKNTPKGALPKISVRKVSPEVQQECDRALAAETVLYEDGEMVYHPLLQHLPCSGFASDPEECAEMLHSHAIDAPKRLKVYCFATTRECCQRLDVSDLLESASQDMFEDWQERVEADCAAEIKMAQATMDALHDRLMDFPTFRADLTRVHILPLAVRK